MNRKDFINKIIRYGIFIFLVALSANLIVKRTSSGKKLCEENEVCSSCKKLPTCTLPEANKTRLNERE